MDGYFDGFDFELDFKFFRTVRKNGIDMLNVSAFVRWFLSWACYNQPFIKKTFYRNSYIHQKWNIAHFRAQIITNIRQPNVWTISITGDMKSEQTET